MLSAPAGELFAQAPVKEYPGIAVETVSDSSRYFVLRIQDDNGDEWNIPALSHASSNTFNPLSIGLWVNYHLLLAGRSAFVGVGFGDRGDAFDFNVALQDHFKWAGFGVV